MLVLPALISFVSVTAFAARTIDPSNVDIATRETWCNNQKEACPLICDQVKGSSGKPSENDCDPETLDYHCVCSNNVTPNATEFSQTIPFYICEEANNVCVNECDGSACQSDCRQNNPCGASNPTRVNDTTTATVDPTATGTSTSTATDVVYDGMGDDSGSSDGDESAAGRIAVLQVGQVYGMGIVIAGILAGFTLVL